ncbi:hypothetical protein [Catenulispora acidiphila]|uniref:hypothetical protein n=1 Tax=Catenulispora acidiphila TaxID=304895 RepID=UPI000304786D|nr:hypothetical protein [Catenulispora acidiphila]
MPASVDKQLAKAIAGPLGVVDGGGNRLAATPAAGAAGASGASGTSGAGQLSAADAAGLRSALPHGGAASGLKPSRP